MNASKPSRLYTISITKSQSIRLAGYGTLLIFLAAGLFSIISRSDRELANPVIELLVFVGTIILHELIHGLFFRLYGGRPRYGVGLMYKFLPYAYATTPNQPYSLAAMAAILLASFVLLSLLACVLAVALPHLAVYMAVAFVSNFSGAIGDLWLLWQLSKFRHVADLRVIDLANGLAVHGRSDAKTRQLLVSLRDRDQATPNHFLGVWMAATLSSLIITLLLPLLITMTGQTFQQPLVIGPSQLPLFVFQPTGGGSTYTFNLLPSIVIGLLFTLLYHAIKRLRT